MSQIAYVGQDGRIYLMNDAASEPVSVTPPEYTCSWPTWSPNGKRIAYSAMRTSLDGSTLLGVFTKRIDEENSRYVYINDPGTGIIAASTPHYLNWSPDSDKLGLIAQTTSAGISLFIHKVTDSAQPAPVIDGGPLYFSWSYDSRYLIAHSFDSHYMVDLAEEKQPRKIPGVSTLYMSPSWSPVAHEMALCRDLGSNRQTLMIGGLTNARVQAVAQIEGATSFSWSPDGKSIAFLRNLNRRTGFYSGLWLASVESLEPYRVSEDPILSFFWSPNGEKIAYITPSDGAEGSIRWAVIEVDDGKISYMPDFRPAQQQLITFMFFDQYSQSHSPWSADSTRLTFCGELGYQLVRAVLPEDWQSSVFVVEVSGTTPPVEVAKGTFAVWSPAVE